MINYPLKNNTIIFLFLAVLLAPVPGVLFGPMSIRIIDLSVVLFALFALIIFIFSNKDHSLNDWLRLFLKDKIIWFIVLASISVVISTVAGSILFPQYTGIFDVYELYRYAYYFAFYILVAYMLTDIQKFYRASFISVIIIQLFGILQFFNVFDINNNLGLLYTKNDKLHMMIEVQHRITSTLGNPNVYGSFLLIVLCFLLSYLYLNKNKTINLYVYLSIALTIFSIFLTTSRTTVIVAFGILFYAAVYFAILRYSSFGSVLLKLVYTLISFVVIAFLLVPNIPYLDSAFSSMSKTLEGALSEIDDPELEEVENNDTPVKKEGKKPSKGTGTAVKESLESVNSFKNRYDYWQENITIFKQSPIVGAGPMKEGLSFADNSYLYILARYGVLGFLIYALFFGYSYFKTFAINFKKQEGPDRLIIAATLNLLIVAYAVMGVVSEVWFNIDSMVVFFVILGLLKNKKTESI